MENTFRPVQRILLLILAVAIVGGCRSSGSGAGADTAPAAASPVPREPSENLPPEISGNPPDTAVIGEAYRFVPQAQDADGDSLVFTIENRPIWATFNSNTGMLSGTPAASHEGTSADVTISVTDGKQETNLLPFDLHVRPRTVVTRPAFSGAAPNGTAMANSHWEFTPTMAPGVYGNILFSIRNRPEWAQFDTQSGQLSGTPDDGDVGTYFAITITATNLAGSTDMVPFNLTVVAASNSNTPPEISGTPATTALVGSEYRFTPDSSDPDGDDLTFAVSGKPAWATFNSVTGRLRGTPSANNVGRTGSISIAVSDGEFTRNLPAFRIDVVEPQSGNSAPQISGVPESTAQSGQPWSFTPNASDPDGDSLLFSVNSKPAWLSFNTGTGRLSGTPSDADAGTYPNIVIAVTDGDLMTALPAFSIEVTRGNRAPAISGTPQIVAIVGQAYEFTPTATDPDADTLTFSTTGVPSWSSFDTATGRIHGTPAIGDVGISDPVTITVSDGTTESALQPFSIRVEEQIFTSIVMSSEDGYIKENQPDTPLGDKGKLVVKDNVLQMSFVDFEFDKPAAGTELLSAKLKLPIQFVLEPGSIRLHRIRSAWSENDLTFRNAPTYVANADHQVSIDLGDEGREVSTDVTQLVSQWLEEPNRVHGVALLPADVTAILYSAEAGKPMELTMTFSASGSAANQAPSVDAGADASGRVDEWIPLAGFVTDDGLPTPPGQTLVSWYAESGPGTVTFEDGTRADTRARFDQAGTYVLKLAGDDGEVVSEDQVRVTVEPNNGAPTIGGKPPATATVGERWLFTPQASDPNGDDLSFSISNKPDWASFNAGSGQLSGTPAENDVGLHGGIQISVTDGEHTSELSAFSVLVETSNSAPVISGTPATTVQAGQAYSFLPTASDPDGDTLEFQIVKKPGWANFNRTTGKLSGTPAASDSGNYTGIRISVSDGSSTSSLPTFAISVTVDNAAPTIGGTPSAEIVAGNNYFFRPTASDADGDDLTFSITGKPAWASFKSGTGKLSGTPQAADAGTYGPITITVSDGTNESQLGPFEITVIVPEQASGSATLNWDAPDRNVDGSNLNDLSGYRIYGGTASGSLTLVAELGSAGVTSYVIDNLGKGTHHFEITALNSAGAESARSNRVTKTIP